MVRCNSNYVKLAVGEWGEESPVYKLKSVTKKGKKWKVVFKVNMYDSYTDSMQPLGKVILTFEKKNKKNLCNRILTIKRNYIKENVTFFLFFCAIITLLKYNQCTVIGGRRNMGLFSF